MNRTNSYLSSIVDGADVHAGDMAGRNVGKEAGLGATGEEPRGVGRHRFAVSSQR